MIERLLTFLRCAACAGELDLLRLAPPSGAEVSEGLLGCDNGHWYPVVGGIPRLLPEAISDHWVTISKHVDRLPQELRSPGTARSAHLRSDVRTKESFSLEWSFHELGAPTWGMTLDERVRHFFFEPLRLSLEELEGRVVLDAGCGNGSQSVAYTQYGAEVLAVDLSNGVEKGQAYRGRHANARPVNVHFIQADLRYPPIARGSVDIIHSAGVLHHTPSTRETFRCLVPLLRPGGLFYVWLYRHEPVVTPLVDTLRVLTTRVPPRAFARVAAAMAPPFKVFRQVVNALGLRAYGPISRKEAALALIDIFGSPYAHHHSVEEVEKWYGELGFEEVWRCGEDGRGFGVCGRLPAASTAAVTPGPDRRGGEAPRPSSA